MRFDHGGKVVRHIDYWVAADQPYEHLPGA